jgi:hypothetical protein
MLDYDECKKIYAEKIASDWSGRGRMESAFFLAIRFAYEKGLQDGATPNAVLGVYGEPTGESNE